MYISLSSACAAQRILIYRGSNSRFLFPPLNCDLHLWAFDLNVLCFNARPISLDYVPDSGKVILRRESSMIKGQPLINYFFLTTIKSRSSAKLYTYFDPFFFCGPGILPPRKEIHFISLISPQRLLGAGGVTPF